MSLPLLPECHRLPPKLLLLLLPLLPATWYRLSGKPGDSCLAGILFLSPSFPLSLQYFFLADLSCLNGSDHSCPGPFAQAELLCKAPSTGNIGWSQFVNSLLHSPRAQVGFSLILVVLMLRSMWYAGAPWALQADLDAGIALCNQCCHRSHVIPN